MKKFLICLVCFLGVFTLCFATSTVANVYFNNFGILVNGENYLPNLPILNYQSRTYLPLNEFASITGNNVTFENDTIIIDQNVSNLKYKKLFLVYSVLRNIDKNVITASIYFDNCYADYCLYYTESLVKEGFATNKSNLDAVVQSIDFYYSYRDLVTSICLEYNLATATEINNFFDNVKYYPLFLQESAKLMELHVNNNLPFEDYSNHSTLCSNGNTDINNFSSQIQSKIADFFVQN